MVHTLLELFAITVAVTVVTSAWTTFDSDTHGRSQVFIAGFTVVAVCDTVSERAQSAGEANNVPWFTSLEEMLERVPSDAVVIATPPGPRFALARAALEAGKALLLEKGAAANAVPQLEIFADDVKCAHGATVGQLDEQARFYMAARGISPDAARRLLVQAFLGDAFVALDNDDERERLMQAALAALGDAV